MLFFSNFKLNNKKIYFLIFGILNFIITNLVLQVSLLFLPIFISTITSQFINIILGCLLYGRRVFGVKKITLKIFKRYLILAFFLWVTNASLISFLYKMGINKNIAALLLVPLLVLISYSSYNKYVFKK